MTASGPIFPPRRGTRSMTGLRCRLCSRHMWTLARPTTTLRWVPGQRNLDGGFGLSQGDHSRVFATSVVSELIVRIRGGQETLRAIADFVRNSYDPQIGS